MKRNLKVLGLAVVAALALSGVVAQAALAVDHTFEVTASSADLKATNSLHGPEGEETSAHVLSAGAAKISCAEAHFSGKAPTQTADSVTLKPEYKNCTIGANPAQVVVNGCEYTFDSDTTANPAETTSGESGTVVVCKGGGTIEVKAAGCIITFGEQGPLHGVTYTNEGSEPTGVGTTAHVFGIKYTTNKVFACQLAGFPASGAGSNGTYLGNATLKAYETGTENQVGAHVTTP